MWPSNSNVILKYISESTNAITLSKSVIYFSEYNSFKMITHHVFFLPSGVINPDADAMSLNTTFIENLTTEVSTTPWITLTEPEGTVVLPSADPPVYKDFYLRARFITGLICYPIFCFLGLSGNILSVIVMSRQKMATSTNVYLTALAISDSIKLINDSFYFLVILLLETDPPAGKKAYGYLYPYAHYFFNMSVCVTAWLTVSVAAERYVMVCHAARARDMCNMGRAKLTCVIVFLSMSLLTVPFALKYQATWQMNNDTNTTELVVQVTELWTDKDFKYTFTWITNLLRSVIPLCILVTFNYFIVQALRKTRSNKRKLSSRHRITLMLVSVIVLFLICVTPDAIMSTFFGFGYYEANFLVRGVREITDLLLTVNSAMNFVLYCTFNKIFRRNFMHLFCHRCCPGRFGFEDTVFRRSSFATFRGTTIVNGTSRKVPLCENEWIQSSAM